MAYMGLQRGLGRHLDGTMTKTMLLLLIVKTCVLGIVDQHIRALHEVQKVAVAAVLPFDIGGIDQAAPGVFDAINDRAVSGMVVGKTGNDTHLLRAFAIVAGTPGF